MKAIARADPVARRRARPSVRWLLARRSMQLALLAAFAGAPWWGAPLVQGTLASSLWLGTLPLSDPFVLLQSLLAGHAVAGTAWLGAALVALAAALLAGRLYCACVCPINLVTDAADALRRVLGWRASLLPRPDRHLRRVLLLLVLLACVALGRVVWEALNPISFALRALAFGAWGAGALAVAAVFCFDLLLLRHGWCGHLCPVGALYGALGRFGALHVAATRAAACTHCGDCFEHCPEPQVIAPVLQLRAASPRIADTDCRRCGRCIDRCSETVFEWRLGRRDGAAAGGGASTPG